MSRPLSSTARKPAAPAATTVRSMTPHATGFIRLAMLGLICVVFLPLSIKTSWGIRIFSIDAAILTMPVLLHTGRRRTLLPYRLIGDKLDVLFYGFPVLLAVNCIFSSYVPNSLDATFLWLRVASIYGISKYVIRRGLVPLHAIRRWLLIVFLVLLAVGYIQWLTESSFGMVGTYFGESREEGITTVTLVQRVSGTSNHPNIFGQWLVMLGIFVLSHLFFARNVRFRCWAIAALTGVEGALLMATLSRGCLLFFAFSLGVLAVVWIRTNTALKLPLVLVAFCLVGPLVPMALDSVLDKEVAYHLERRMQDNGDEFRKLMLMCGLELMRRPHMWLTGTGMGAFFPATCRYGIDTSCIWSWMDLSDSALSLHNIPMMFIVEGGVIIGTAFIFLYLSILVRAYRLLKAYRHTDHLPVVAALFCNWVGLLLPMQVYMSTFTYPVIFVVAVLMGVTAGIPVPPPANLRGKKALATIAARPQPGIAAGQRGKEMK
ncbi:MAG: hypothetical protein HQ559_13215 [Lentisphaerae bacterium]|nr:hypothetical protein [Lentisphaerota bacterium]